MRNEAEMMELIIRVAKSDDRIRAVYMNGSRTNPNAPKDIFQDYDIVYAVKETTTFLHDKNWIKIFGDMIMVQEPDKLNKGLGYEVELERTYAYLMLFTDGNRIDLRLQILEAVHKDYSKDKLTIPLLDKDGILTSIPSPTDTDYHVSKPDIRQFESCTNDFWWCLQNVGKGLWRKELPYAKSMFEYTTRTSLDEMVNWWVGIETDFQVSTGKLGKYFEKYLPEQHWNKYQKTYSDSNYDNMWKSVFEACELFRALSEDVAKHFNFSYPYTDDDNMMNFLLHIEKLPTDARNIY